MKKILVIENDAGILDIVVIIFRDKGFEVLASKTKVTIERIIQQKPNLILLDYLLDDACSKEICLEIKNNPLTHHIPVIILSAITGLEEIAQDSCADAFIAKPFEIDDLEQMVDKMAL